VTAADERPIEAEAFLTALQDQSPGALTACEGWTVHDLGAHLAGAFEEVIRHVRAYQAGSPLTSTRTFEEREPEFRALPPARLLRAVERGEQDMRSSVTEVLATEPDATLAWTGRTMRIDAFTSHLRNECALHRWDMLGDDETSWRLLSRPKLLEHSIGAVGAGPLCGRGMARDAAEGRALSARVRSDGQQDLLVTVDGNGPSLTLTEPGGEPTVVGDPAARLLMLWGRTPAPAVRLRTVGDHDDAIRVRRLFSGY
jgi:hypothetical protein